MFIERDTDRHAEGRGIGRHAGRGRLTSSEGEKRGKKEQGIIEGKVIRGG